MKRYIISTLAIAILTLGIAVHGKTDNKSGEEINWQVISGGGSDGGSATYRNSGTVGQTAVGKGSTEVLTAYHGFWQFCCVPPMRGNVDYDSLDQIDISDLVYLVDYMFNQGPAAPCFEEADMNCDGSIDISDLVYLVDYMFNQGPPPCRCDCTDCP